MSLPTSLSEPWQLPDGVDELLPAAAWQVENLRRSFIDQCHRCGFDLVMPPMIEYIDSLLTGTGETMNLQTFKLVDQQNGRTLGVRADITPQVARMDAHALNRQGPNRLFYVGTVLRARADGFGGSRSPTQFGAELFGHAGPESDIEIIRLMLDSILLTGVKPDSLVLDLGHVGIFKALVESAALSEDTTTVLYDALRRGSIPDVAQVIAGLEKSQINPSVDALSGLLELRGDETVLERARADLASLSPAISSSLDTLSNLIAAVKLSHPDVLLHIDIGELRGYRYHTGALFAVHSKTGVELARGGRYDAIGAAFGHPRSATGFSGDMKNLSDIMLEQAEESKAVYVDHTICNDCREEISTLRQQGNRVVVGLPGMAAELQNQRCDRQLLRQDNQWLVQPINHNS